MLASLEAADLAGESGSADAVVAGILQAHAREPPEASKLASLQPLLHRCFTPPAGWCRSDASWNVKDVIKALEKEVGDMAAPDGSAQAPPVHDAAIAHEARAALSGMTSGAPASLELVRLVNLGRQRM